MAADGKKRKLKIDAASDSPPGSTLMESDSCPQPVPSCSFKVPGLMITNHHFRVPLDHSGQVEGEIDLFVREVVSLNSGGRQLPFLLFLQGGPGFEAPRPVEASAWLKTAVNSFRVLLMDQRGTGRSTAVTSRNLAKRGTAGEQARYLTFFRADSIVRDAEIVRKIRVPKDCFDGRWSVLGQSFGGFCILTYLSFASEGLIEALITGGIPPCIAQPCSADAVYRALFPRVISQNKKFYTRFPGDVALVQRIVRFLQAQPGGGVLLPSGSRLTPRGLQLLGQHGLGMGGAFDRLHYLLEEFFDSEGDITPGFMKAYENWISFDVNPLYALLHESIYCQQAGVASGWSAHRIREEEYQAQFDAEACVAKDLPVLFTGEMVFPWMFEDMVALRPYKAAADLVAAKSDWTVLYDTKVLQVNKCPVVALTYLEDLYVDYQLAQETAQEVGNLRQWMTNEYKHSGIRDDGVRIFDRLLNMARDTIPIE